MVRSATDTITGSKMLCTFFIVYCVENADAGAAQNFVYLLNRRWMKNKISSAAPALGLLHWQ